jgi:hypothetical protein
MKESDHVRFVECAKCEETYGLLATSKGMICRRHTDMLLFVWRVIGADAQGKEPYLPRLPLLVQV